MHYTNAFIRGKKAPFRGVFKYKDSEGNWHQTVRTLKAQGIADARRELTELRAQLEEEHEQAQFVARTTMTVGEYVENYINRLDETKVIERSTVNGYLCMLGYIRDGLDKVRLTQLSAAQIQAWEAKLLTDGLSATTVRKAHMLLKSALKYAVETEVLPKNPMAPVKAPKIDTPLPNALDDGARRLLSTRHSPTRSTTARGGSSSPSWTTRRARLSTLGCCWRSPPACARERSAAFGGPT